MFKRIFNLQISSDESAFLWGARKTGKSTYLKDNFPNSVRFDFLNSSNFIKYSKAPWKIREEILNFDKEKLSLPIILDEVQKIPHIMDEVHNMIENYGISFILCGSSTRKMIANNVNLLGGRALKFHFFPLLYPEIKNDFDLIKIFNNGLIPQHYMKNNATHYLNSYIEDYLINEIRSEALIRDLPGFLRFFEAVGFSHGEMINYANIARDSGVSAVTVKEHFQILVDTLIGYFLEPFRGKDNRTTVSSISKFYFFDIGIANRLKKVKIFELKGIESGNSLEHYIFLELYSYIKLNILDYKLSYWRTHTGSEVDFIVHFKNENIIPIEVKISSNLHKTDLKNLRIFMNKFSVKKGYIVCNETESRKIKVNEGEIITYPVKQFLENLWNKKIIK